MHRSIIGLLILLTTWGCSGVNVEVDSDNTPAHEKIFRDEMEGRSVDYVPPRVLELPPLEISAEAGKVGLKGMIMVRVLVGRDGRVIEAQVTQGLDEQLDSAALKAARGGSYAPATESDIATDGWIIIPFRYPPPAGKTE